MITAPDVMGAAEVRQRLNISRPTLAVYRSRPDFPPARELSSGPVWETRAIEAFALQRETHKPFLDVLRAYRGAQLAHGVHQDHAVSVAASTACTTGRTARTMLETLGEIA